MGERISDKRRAVIINHVSNCFEPAAYTDSQEIMQLIDYVLELGDALKAERAVVEELEAMPNFHHPDCNWWKWDFRYSWDKTDCNCAECCGPTLEEQS